ncbi:acyl-CoA dehydrogenase, partial [Salmonella enterica subsp. enterica]|nr:acyl-CoA dehydrogenase [Salmonella enterica subsp. enterica serovar Enteritidis]
MNFALTEEQAIFKDSVLKFSKRNLEAGAQQRAHSGEYPFDVAKLMAQEGLLGLSIPAEQGGMGGTVLDSIIAIETVASVCPKSADVVQAGNFGAIRVLAEYCTPEQREKFLTRLLAGEQVISVGMTEPDAGSAVTELKTTATPDGDGFRINGSKIFTTHGPFADIILAYVRFGPGVDGIGSVLLERGMPGFTAGNKMKFMSGEEWATLTFDNVFVPAGNILLRNGGFKKQIEGFNVERLGN